MPPRTRITREAIVDSAFSLIREQGLESLNTRTLAAQLGCSTQPILYQFDTMGDVRKAAYAKADEFHSRYLVADLDHADSPLLALGLNYVRFAHEEPHLFRFLFMSNGLGGDSVTSLVEAPEAEPLIALVAREAGLNPGQAQHVFLSIFVTAHGYASLLATNALSYEESQVEQTLIATFTGAMTTVKEDLS